MSLIIDFFKNFLDLTNAMSIYMLGGLLVAGILKQIIPDDFISSHLGKNSIISVIKATILGIPLPVCSCSVVPLAKSLEKEGASRGAVQSFLISTPITGVDSIMATYSFFGVFFTIYRVITSVVMAIIAGILQNFVKVAQKDEEIEEQEEESCNGHCSCSSSIKEKKKFSIKMVFKYAYVTLFGDMAKALFYGLLIGAAFTTFIPKDLLNMVFQHQYLTYLLVLVISLPMYVCATSSLPIVASLMLGGMTGGAGFIFLSAGPATNSVTMGVVAQMFGKKSLFIYLGVISGLSILFGVVFDLFFADINIMSTMQNMEQGGIIEIIASIIMLLLIAYFLLKPLFNKKTTSCCSGDSCCSSEEKEEDSCCSGDSCCSSEKEEASTVLICPICSEKGQKVVNTVFKSNLKPDSFKKIDLDVNNYICLNSKCEIAYYNEKIQININELRRELWFKTSSKRKIICYCNNIDEEQIEEAVNEHNLTTWNEITSHYRKKVIENCENLNPTGHCCRKNFDETVKQFIN